MKTVRYAQHISGAAAAIFVLGVYLLFNQVQPVESYERNYSVSQISPGQTLLVTGTAMRTDSCARETTRQWIDRQGNNIIPPGEDFEAMLPAGQRSFAFAVKVPDNLPAGMIRYRVRSVYYCNFLQRAFGIGSTFVLPDVIFNAQATP